MDERGAKNLRKVLNIKHQKESDKLRSITLIADVVVWLSELLFRSEPRH